MRRIYRRPKPKIDSHAFRVNGQITAPVLFVIDAAGNNLGVLSREAALKIADEEGFDLVEVSPKADPPVAKITDSGRLKYKKEKLLQKQKASQKKIDTKSIRLSLRISPHDRETRINQAVKFLLKGNKLKIEIVLRGREKQLRAKAVEIVTGFANELKEKENLSIAEEQPLTNQPSGFNMILINKFK